ncbi:MAG TPA: cysteine desulfurase [Pseudomonadales bacterium]
MKRRTDIAALRAEFPLLAAVGELTYLDSAATTQKPTAVLDAIRNYYVHDNANVHRAAHSLADRATTAFENARVKAQKFIGAAHPHEIVWTRGTTESINLVAQSYGASMLRAGDEILVSVMEHHSNIVPWQLVAQRTGASLKAIDVNDRGEIDLEDYARKLNSRTRIVAIGHVSNALGTINPIKQIIATAHAAGAVVLIDGAQAAAHLPIDVVDLDCDFYALSAHKMFGPTGIGVLYGKARLLDAMPPWQGGGEMIETVTIERTTYNRLPYKFEAGTPDIAGVVGLGAAIDYLDSIDAKALRTYEARIMAIARARLGQLEGVRIVGTAAAHTGVVSFVVDGSHPHDVGTLLDQQGIAVRSGHHCAMPLMQRLNVPGTVRASFCLYNSERDIDRLVAGLEKVRNFL